MLLKDAKIMALALMETHGLIKKGWSFEFDNSKRRFGVCKSWERIIGLSSPLTQLNSVAEVKNTILHEIAHALVGFGHNHDRVWKAKAIEIGCDGERCFSSNEVNLPPSKYVAVCVKCERVHKREKRISVGKHASCGRCSGGKYNPTYKLEFVPNTKKL